jgi:hypothetical protein
MAYWQDDTFDTWPEVYRVGTAAIGLYSRCGAYCARELTDGHIPAELVTSYGTREWAQKLVEVGLWETTSAGYRDVYFLVGKKGNKLNPTREEALAKLKQAADRTAKWRANSKKKGVTRHVQGSDASRDGIRDASSDASPSLPPSYEGKGSQALPSPVVEEGVSNPDWRRGKSFGTEPDPVEADRARRGAEAARAALSRPAAARQRPGPVEAARQRGSSLDALDEVLAQVIPLHATEVPDAEAG